MQWVPPGKDGAAHEYCEADHSEEKDSFPDHSVGDSSAEEWPEASGNRSSGRTISSFSAITTH